MKTIKEYVLEEFSKEEMKDICFHGMVNGFGQLVYYHDTVNFHDTYEDEIWDMLEEDRISFGHKTIMNFIGSEMNTKDVGSMDQLKNLLCWWAVERTCLSILNEGEQ